MKGFVVVILCLTCFLIRFRKKTTKKIYKFAYETKCSDFFLRLTETCSMCSMCVHVWNCRQYFCRLIVFFQNWVTILQVRMWNSVKALQFVSLVSLRCACAPWLSCCNRCISKIRCSRFRAKIFFFLVRVRTKSSKLDRFVKQSLYDGVETVVLVVTFFWTRFDRI